MLNFFLTVHKNFPKISRELQKFPGNSKNFPGISGNEIYGNFPGFPGRDFPGTSPSRYDVTEAAVTENSALK